MDKKHRKTSIKLFLGLFTAFLFISILLPTTALAFDYMAVDSRIDALSLSSIATVRTIGTSHNNRAIKSITITGSGGISASKPSILFVGGHHGDESPSVEIPLRLAEYLVASYTASNAVRDMVDNSVITIVPLVNPDGYVNETRTNAFDCNNNGTIEYGNGTNIFEGVNLNRNYRYDNLPIVGNQTSDLCNDINFWGEVPFSEPEVIAIRDLINQNTFKVVISYHAGNTVVVYPYAQRSTLSIDDYLFQNFGTGIGDAYGFQALPIYYALAEPRGATGVMDDWVYDTKAIPIFTIELGPKVLTQSQISDLFSHTLASLNYLINWIQRGPAIELVIDRSGSMLYDVSTGTYDPQKFESTKNAASLFVELMQEKDKVGVVSFSTYSANEYSLTEIDGSGTTKSSAISRINALQASGNTSIGSGILRAQNQLDTRASDDALWAMVLLSDGQENTPPYVNDVLPSIENRTTRIFSGETRKKTRIFTIGLGGGADAALLNDIANRTDGGYYFAPTAQQLQEIYNRILTELTGSQTIVSIAGSISQGSIITQTVPIDSSVSNASFIVSWPGSDIDLTLVNPAGIVVDPTLADNDPNIEYVSSTTYEFYKVAQPLAGVWTMMIHGVDIPPQGEQYTVIVNGNTDLKLLVDLDRDEYLANRPMQITARLNDAAGAIVGASLVADVITPTDTGILTLYDDGLHNDQSANDGIYSNSWSVTGTQGSYTFRVSASGTSNSQEAFTRTATQTTIVGRDSDNDNMPDIWEDNHGLNKYYNDAQLDPDQDGLTNVEEYNKDTDPQVSDTDGDGFSDGEEVDSGSDPLDPNSVPTTNSPPVANAGVDQTVECASSNGTAVNLDGSGSLDPDGDALSYYWSGIFGTANVEKPPVAMPLGTHEVTLLVNDGKIDSEPDTVNITVQDTTPPELIVNCSPQTLWPPNHKMVEIIPSISSSDICDSNVSVELYTINQNEGDQLSTYDPDFDATVGDGNTENDYQIDTAGRIFLRAERSALSIEGRLYSITYKATDQSGNSSLATCKIAVPHDQN